MIKHETILGQIKHYCQIKPYSYLWENSKQQYAFLAARVLSSVTSANFYQFVGSV